MTHNSVKPRRHVQKCVHVRFSVNLRIHVHQVVCVRCQCIHVLQAPRVTRRLLINHSIHCLGIHSAGLKTVLLCLCHTRGWLMLYVRPNNPTNYHHTHTHYWCAHVDSGTVRGVCACVCLKLFTVVLIRNQKL